MTKSMYFRLLSMLEQELLKDLPHITLPLKKEVDFNTRLSESQSNYSGETLRTYMTNLECQEI